MRSYVRVALEIACNLERVVDELVLPVSGRSSYESCAPHSHLYLILHRRESAVARVSIIRVPSKPKSYWFVSTSQLNA